MFFPYFFFILLFCSLRFLRIEIEKPIINSATATSAVMFDLLNLIFFFLIVLKSILSVPEPSLNIYFKFDELHNIVETAMQHYSNQDPTYAKKLKQQGAFMQSSTHQALVLGL